MAKTLSTQSHTLRLNIVTSIDGVPQSAYVDYRMEDGAAFKTGRFQLVDPDFTKIMQNAGVAGEFWIDMVMAIKTAEGIV